MQSTNPSLQISRDNGLATVTLTRGKVNAIDQPLLDELIETFRELEADSQVRGALITGSGRFFSFGWDVPVLYSVPKAQFTDFVRSFCVLSREMFLFPKPLVAAVNGHAMAGGCILALTADYRIMNAQAGKIALNEITFGSGLFPAAVEMLRFTAGNRAVQDMLLTGRMLSPVEALKSGVVDELAEEQQLVQRASETAREMARYGGPAFTNLKNLARGPVVDSWLGREDSAIADFVEIWYSPRTRELLKGVQIRS